MIGDKPLTDALRAARPGMRWVLLGRDPQAQVGSPAALLQQT